MNSRILFKLSTFQILCAGFLVVAGGCQNVPTQPCERSAAKRTVVPGSVISNSIQASSFSDSKPTQEDISLVQHDVPIPLPEDITTPEPEQTDHVVSQPIEYFVSVAVGNHPRVRAARARVAAASNRIPQAYALEDPTLRNAFWPIPAAGLQTADGRAVNDLSISQEYPWQEKRCVKEAIAERETRIAAAKLAQAELEVEEMVRLAYYELWFADRAIQITFDNRQIAAELVKLAEARNAAGGSQQDILRAQLQLDDLDNRVIELRQQKALAQADLAALVQQPALQGIEPSADIDVGEVPSRLDALFAAALQCSPRLREQRWAVSRDRQKQELACLGKYPDFMFGVGWMGMTANQAVSPVASGDDNVNFMVGVTLPIWRDRINAAIREASAEVAASSREFQDVRDDAFRQIRRLTDQAYAADKQLRLFNERILPRSKRALQLASAEYRGRQVDFGELASGFTEVLMFELQAARAKATLAGTMAQLHRAVGCEVIVDDPTWSQPNS